MLEGRHCRGWVRYMVTPAFTHKKMQLMLRIVVRSIIERERRVGGLLISLRILRRSYTIFLSMILSDSTLWC